MKTRIIGSLAVAAAILGLQIGFSQEANNQPSPAAATAQKGKGKQAPDPRVQQRTYHFADTNVDLPYALFVSSKVSKDRKNPLIIALHGLNADQNSLVRGSAVDLAEEGGYILVGPLGYNVRGWWGIPAVPRPDGAPAPKANPAAANDPSNLRELSEKDFLNVLDMVRKEFNVDERRTYLMGHSMGGAGTLWLGSKYASTWAGIVVMAPAAGSIQAKATDILTAFKDKVPVLVTQGDADVNVRPESTRKWVEMMKELKIDHKYIEMPGKDHISIMFANMPDIFAFFQQHSKQ